MSNPLPESDERRVVLGAIRGAVGLAGWVKVQSYTRPPENILSYPAWQLGQAGVWRPMEIAESRASGGAVQVRMQGCLDRNAADLLKDAEIGIFRRELPLLEPGQYYLDDLQGMEVFTAAGELLGRLDHFVDTPAHPLMMIKGKRNHLVPMVRERILGVDFDKGAVTVDWGLDW